MTRRTREEITARYAPGPAAVVTRVAHRQHARDELAQPIRNLLLKFV